MIGQNIKGLSGHHGSASAVPLADHFKEVVADPVGAANVPLAKKTIQHLENISIATNLPTGKRREEPS